MDKDTFVKGIDTFINMSHTGDIFAMYELNKHLKNTVFFTEEEIFDNIFLNAEKEHNVFSIYDLAQYYREGKFVPESMLKYIQLLMDIAESDIADIVIQHCEDDHELNFAVGDIIDAMMIRDVIGAACFELALYYKNASDIDLLRNAERYASYALSCKYPSYPGEDVTIKLIAEIQDALDQCDTKPVDINEVICENLDLNNADDFANRIYRKMIAEIGEDVWEKFTGETKNDLFTAVLEYTCLCTLSTDIQGKIDFSSVIMPLMKALEYELKMRFHYGYHHFLQEKKISAEKFVKDNDIKGNLRHARETILQNYKKNGEDRKKLFNPKETEHLFTLGKFRYIIGIGKSSQMKPDGPTADLTVINYCKECINIKDRSESEIDKWLWTLSNNITSISSARNNSAHGGTIMNVNDAHSAFRALIYVEKILIDLVTDFPFVNEAILTGKE